MKPLPAVGLASAIIQIVDFSIKITQKEHKIYQPAEGSIVENHAVLQAVAHNLFRLSLKLDQNDLSRLASEKRGKLSEPAEMLLKLADDAKELTAPLTDAVLQAQAHGTFGDPKWQTVREALSTIWKKKDITGIKKKLKNVRKEVETALLIALQYVKTPPLVNLPFTNCVLDNISISPLRQAYLCSAKKTVACTISRSGRTKPWMQYIPISGNLRTRSTPKSSPK
jgi:hypothetical protein